MKYSEIAGIMDQIESAGIPVTYWEWNEGEVPPLPYAVYLFSNISPEAASDRVHAQIADLNIELYTKTKDFAIEAAVDAVLEANDIVYSKSTGFLRTELMYQTLYHIQEVIENG